jgi:hypothetical protein
MRDTGLESQILFERQHMAGPKVPHRPGSALEVLMNQKNKEVRICVDDVDRWDDIEKDKAQAKTTYTCFKHFVELQYVILDQLVDRQVQIQNRPGINLNFQVRKCLEGWDFRDLAVTAKSATTINTRLKTFDMVRTRGWVDFTREIKAITIFGTWFGDLIRPSDASS